MRAMLIVVVVSACGKHSGGDPMDQKDAPTMVDAKPHGPCWPVDGTTPSGTITLGTGDPYMPMGDMVNVHFGSQNGFDIPVSAETTGLLPGNPMDVLDPSNPRTRFRAFFVDTGDPINPATCPIRLSYVQAASGAYDLQAPSAILFDTGLPESQVFGRQVRVVVEIIDSNNNYATQEKVVTCVAPVGWQSDAGT